MIKRYKKKPVVIEAVQWLGDNFEVINEWSGGQVDYKHSTTGSISVKTLEGVMWANRGDYIIKGVKGEFYPCKPDIFAATYDEVKPE